MVDLISRQQWGAKHEDGAGPAQVPYEGWYLHHTVTVAPDLVAPFDDDDRAIRQLEAIGESRFKRGMSYTRLVTPVGRLYEGHGLGRLGAHTGGLNSKVRAVALVGDYSHNPPTAAQINTIGELLREDHHSGRSKSLYLLGGHRDANVRTGRPGTACPGNAGYGAIAAINAAAAGTPAQPTVVVAPAKPSGPAPGDFLPFDFPLPRGHWFGPPDKRQPKNHSGFWGGRDNELVVVLQQGLRRRGWRIDVDGKYGPGTAGVVGKFQREKGLAVDGLTGIATWSAIDRSPRT